MIDINYKEVGQRIKEFREETNITQEMLAEMLGLKRSTISQIENGKRKITADKLIKLATVFNITVDNLLSLEKQPEIILIKNQKEKKIKPQIRVNVPRKNIEKFKEVLIYILTKVGSKPNIGETVIYKLLYFIDFDFYEKYEEQLIGATYTKNIYGPAPLEFKEIVKEMIEDKEIEKIESKYFKFPQIKYLPLREPDLTKFKAHEIEMIDEVLYKLSDSNANQISEYSHNDVPWLVTEDGNIIDYETVFYRTIPYSVRSYPEDIQKN